MSVFWCFFFYKITFLAHHELSSWHVLQTSYWQHLYSCAYLTLKDVWRFCGRWCNCPGISLQEKCDKADICNTQRHLTISLGTRAVRILEKISESFPQSPSVVLNEAVFNTFSSNWAMALLRIWDGQKTQKVGFCLWTKVKVALKLWCDIDYGLKT